MAITPPTIISTTPTRKIFINAYSGGIQTVQFFIQNTSQQAIKFRLSTNSSILTFEPNIGTIPGRSETKIEITANSYFSNRPSEFFTIQWINASNNNQNNFFNCSGYRGNKNIEVIFNMENRIVVNGPFDRQQTINTRVCITLLNSKIILLQFRFSTLCHLMRL